MSKLGIGKRILIRSGGVVSNTSEGPKGGVVVKDNYDNDYDYFCVSFDHNFHGDLGDDCGHKNTYWFLWDDAVWEEVVEDVGLNSGVGGILVGLYSEMEEKYRVSRRAGNKEGWCVVMDKGADCSLFGIGVFCNNYVDHVVEDKIVRVGYK